MPARHGSGRLQGDGRQLPAWTAVRSGHRYGHHVLAERQLPAPAHVPVRDRRALLVASYIVCTKAPASAGAFFFPSVRQTEDVIDGAEGGQHDRAAADLAR